MSENEAPKIEAISPNMQAINGIFAPKNQIDDPKFRRIHAVQEFEHRLLKSPKKHPDSCLEPQDIIHDAWVRLAQRERDPTKQQANIHNPKALAFKRVQQRALTALRRSRYIPIHELSPDNRTGVFGSLGKLNTESAITDSKLHIELIQMTEDIANHPRLIDSVGALFSDEGGSPIFEAYVDDDYRLHLTPQAVIYCKAYTELIDLAEKTDNFPNKAVLAYLHNVSGVSIENTMKFLDVSKSAVYGLRTKAKNLIIGNKNDRKNTAARDKFDDSLQSVIGLLEASSGIKLGFNRRFFTPIYEMSTSIKIPNLQNETAQAVRLLENDPKLEKALTALDIGDKPLHQIRQENGEIIYSPSSIWFCRLYCQLSQLENTYNHFGRNNIIAHLHKLSGLNVPDSAALLEQTEYSVASLRSRIKSQLEIVLSNHPEIARSIEMYKLALMIEKILIA